MHTAARWQPDINKSFKIVFSLLRLLPLTGAIFFYIPLRHRKCTCVDNNICMVSHLLVDNRNFTLPSGNINRVAVKINYSARIPTLYYGKVLLLQIAGMGGYMAGWQFIYKAHA